MKKIHLLFFFLFFASFFSSCNDDSNPFNGNDQLPAITQTGVNTVGCLVNGKVFLPKQEGINPPVNCFYQLVDGEFYFSLDLSDLRGSTNKTVNIFTSKIQLEVGVDYILNKPDDPSLYGAGGEYRLGQADQYNTNNVKIGLLKLSKIDLQNSIISGTFWFDAINSNGEVVEIREGRFDWNY